MVRRKLLVVLTLVNQTPPDRWLLTRRVMCRQKLGVEKRILPQWKSTHWEEDSVTATLCLFSNVFDVCLSSASFCTSKYLYCTGVWLTLILQKWNSCCKISFWANFKTYMKISHYMVMVCTYMEHTNTLSYTTYVHTSQAHMCKCTHTHFNTHNGEVRNKWICFFRSTLSPHKL